MYLNDLKSIESSKYNKIANEIYVFVVFVFNII